MSSPYDPNRPYDQNPTAGSPEPVIDDLMIRDEEEGDESEPRGAERERISSSMRETLHRIPESLSSIGRDISRTIERAISAKDDYVVAVKLSHDAQERLDQLVAAGVFRGRAEAAAFLIDEGIKSQSELFERVSLKLSEIERLRAELRGMVSKTE